MKSLSETASRILNKLNAEWIDYKTEYLPILEAVQRLAEYERAGFEPHEIEEQKFFIAAQKDPEKLKRLRELVEADADGRCIILPCKIGDTIYKIGYTTCKNGETHPDSYGCCGCYDECDMKVCVKEFVVPSLDWIMVHYGEFIEGVWYFTKDDAKSALEEMRK